MSPHGLGRLFDALVGGDGGNRSSRNDLANSVALVHAGFEKVIFGEHSLETGVLRPANRQSYQLIGSEDRRSLLDTCVVIDNGQLCAHDFAHLGHI